MLVLQYQRIHNEGIGDETTVFHPHGRAVVVYQHPLVWIKVKGIRILEQMRILSHIHLWVREYEAINTTGVVSPRRRLWPTDTLDRWQLPRHTRRQYETIDLLSHLRMQTLNWFMYLRMWTTVIPLYSARTYWLCLSLSDCQTNRERWYRLSHRPAKCWKTQITVCSIIL